MRRGCFITIASIVILVMAGAIYWMQINTVPDVTFPKPPPLPSPNAYDYFVAARQLDRDSDKWTFAVSTKPPGYKDPSDPDDRNYTVAEQEALLGENMPFIAKIRQGLSYRFQAYTKPHSFEPEYASMREDARILGFAGKVYQEEGNWNEAVQSELDAVQLGGQISEGSALIGRLVDIACESIGRRHAWDAIDHLSGQQALAATLRLESMRSHPVPMAETIENEKWNMEKLLLDDFRQPGWKGTALAASRSMMGKAPPLQMLFTSKRAILSHYAMYMDAYAERVRQPYSVQMVMKPLPLPSDPISREIADIDFEQTLFRVNANDAQNDLLMTSLALRAYKVDNGDYPTSLSELVPRYLSALPPDPFSASGSFQYHRTAAKYLLYSLGPDMKDDHGKPAFNSTYTGRFRNYVEKDSKGDIVAGMNF